MNSDNAPFLRLLGRAHNSGQFLYEIVLNGQVVAKVCATTEHAQLMADALGKTLSPPDNEAEALLDWLTENANISFIAADGERVYHNGKDPASTAQPLYNAIRAAIKQEQS